MIVSPLFLMIAWSLSGIEPIKFWSVPSGINFHALRSRRLRLFIVCGSGSAYTVVVIILQMFSIGDKSGEFGGQSIGEMNPAMFVFNHSIEVFEVCARAPSCWNNPSRFVANSFVSVKSVHVFVRRNAGLTSFSSISLM